MIYNVPRRWLLTIVALLLATSVFASPNKTLTEVSLAQLPIEAQQTLARIQRGGPFPHKKDGAIFGNHEKLLPKQKRGYYHEFTVNDKNARNRGARRIVVGGTPPVSKDLYYTDDHYATFKRIKEQ